MPILVQSASVQPVTAIHWRIRHDTPGLVYGQPFTIKRLGDGDVLLALHVFIATPFDGTSPRLTIGPLSHQGQAQPITVNLAQAKDDVFGDGSWLGAAMVPEPWLVAIGDTLQAVVDDGSGGDPGSTTGEVRLVLTVLGSP